MGELQKSSQKTNYQFKILYALGMIFVLSGHGADGGISLLYEWFPATSFHVGLFAFCSGYFWKDSASADPKAYIMKKCKTLLLPLFLWNLFYAGVVLLLQPFGFTIGTPVTLSKLTVDVISSGHQFGYNLGGWFIIPLFMIEVFTALCRRLLSKIPEGTGKECGCFLAAMLLGFLGVSIASTGKYEGWWLLLDRFLLLLPFFGLGTFYHRVLEKWDRLSNLAYFAILLVIRVILIQVYGEGTLILWAWCSNLNYGVIGPFLIGFTAIAFWLRVAKILEPAIGRSRTVNAIADNSYSIMVNHLFAFMLLKFFFYALFRFTPLCQGFDCDAFRTDIWYLYSPFYENRMTIVYLIAGLAIPIGMQKLVNSCKRKLFRKA